MHEAKGTTMKTFKTSDESELSNKVMDLIQEGYEPSEETDDALKPGQFRRLVDIDLKPSQPVFTLNWVEIDSI
jgi:hypothetical protein